MTDSSLPYPWPKTKSENRDGKATQSLGEKRTSKPLDDNSFMAQLQIDFPTAAILDKTAYAGTCVHAVNGIELVTDSEGVAYWPATQTLLVADLHLEKGSSFARRGQLIPPYDTITTLRRFAACIEKWDPKRVIALGDSFHDSQASERLQPEALTLLKSLMSGRDWIWITGNHDPEPPVGLGGAVTEEFNEGGLALRHEPLLKYEPGEIAGHLHPKARLVRRGRSIRRSCFAVSRTRMIMPSFGAYTGGLNVFDRAFDGLFGDRDFHALMRGDGQVFRIAASDLS